MPPGRPHSSFELRFRPRAAAVGAGETPSWAGQRSGQLRRPLHGRAGRSVSGLFESSSGENGTTLVLRAVLCHFGQIAVVHAPIAARGGSGGGGGGESQATGGQALTPGVVAAIVGGGVVVLAVIVVFVVLEPVKGCV